MLSSPDPASYRLPPSEPTEAASASVWERDAFRRIALQFTLSLWLFQYLVITVGGMLGEWNSRADIVARTVWFPIGVAISWLVFLIIDRLRSRRFRFQVIVIILLGFPSGLLNALAGRATYHLLAGDQFNAIGLYTGATYWSWFYFGWAAAILAISYSVRAKAEQRMRTEAQALAHRAQMQALRYQLNPHFLFNTLNSAAALILDDQPNAAERMIRKLSSFLRSGLAGDPLSDIELETEIEQQTTYLDIERERFPDRLSFQISVPDSLRSALVPSFLLQPLVENAVKHGVTPSVSPTAIHVCASEEGGMLKLEVTNDATPVRAIEVVGTGLGLRNVERRLATRFGENYGFVAGRTDGGDFRVEMVIPLRLSNK